MSGPAATAVSALRRIAATQRDLANGSVAVDVTECRPRRCAIAGRRKAGATIMGELRGRHASGCLSGLAILQVSSGAFAFASGKAIRW